MNLALKIHPLPLLTGPIGLINCMQETRQASALRDMLHSGGLLFARLPEPLPTRNNYADMELHVRK